MKKILVLCALCMFTASIVGCTGSTTSAPPTDTKVKDTKPKDTKPAS